MPRQRRNTRTNSCSSSGIRKKSGYEEDLGKANPFAIIAVAVGLVVVFVGGLIVLVNWVVKN